VIRGARLRTEKEMSDQDEKECDWKARKRETNEDLCVQSGNQSGKRQMRKLKPLE